MVQAMINNPYTYARISLKNLQHNLGVIRRTLRQGTRVMAVVKSDAYGHGLVPVSKTLEQGGIDGFGVAFVDEGIVLRQAGITAPIYILSGFQRGEEALLIDNSLTPLVYSTAQIELLNRAVGTRNLSPALHLKIDTGMGRLGFVYDDIGTLGKALRGMKRLNITGVATHLSAPRDSRPFTTIQIQRFQAVRQFLETALSKKLIAHAANTDTFFHYPGAVFDMVRSGISLYGYGQKDLKPVLSVFSRLISVKTLKKGYSISYGRTYRLKKNTTVGVIPVGYADGYLRSLSNKAFVGINGKKVYSIGRVTMNHIMIDMHNVPARVGDEVLIMGQDDSQRIGADTVATLGSTISYELLCSMGTRLKRIYE